MAPDGLGINRRHLLESAAIGAAAVFPRRLFSSDDDMPSPSLAFVEIQNHTGEWVDLEMQVQHDGSTIHDRQYEIDPAEVSEFSDGDTYLEMGGTTITEDWMGESVPYHFDFTAAAEGLEAAFNVADRPVGEHTVSNAEASQCYFLRVHIGSEDHPMSTDPDASPDRITVLSEWYDTDIFDRDHVGNCS